MSLTFGLTVFTWIFFRANNIGHAIDYISEILSPSLFTIPNFFGIVKAFPTIILICIFLFVEWIGREGQFAIADIGSKWKRPFRWLMYVAIIFTIFWLGGKEQAFIYFQF